MLDQFERTLDEVPASEAYEHSEMLMYAATVLAEGGKPEEALAYLEKRKVRPARHFGSPESVTS